MSSVQKSSQSNPLSFHPSWFMKRFNPPCRMIIPYLFRQKTPMPRTKTARCGDLVPLIVVHGCHEGDMPVLFETGRVQILKDDASINYDTCNNNYNDKISLKYHEISGNIMYCYVSNLLIYCYVLHLHLQEAF